MIDTIYIGNLYNVAEFIFFSKNFHLIGIFCEEDRINDSILTFSLVRNVPIYKVNKENPIESFVNEQSVDTCFIMCSYGRRVPIEKCGNYKFFNIHYAQLPNYKGRHPTFWATVNNEKYLGVSLHCVTERFDDGAIIAQQLVPYYLWDNESSIFDKLTNEIPHLLTVLGKYLHGDKTIEMIGNNDGMYFHPVTEIDKTINLDEDSPALIFNKVRSQSRAGGAYIILGSKKFRILECRFSCKQLDKSYIINQSLYIKYRDEICIVCDKFEEF